MTHLRFANVSKTFGSVTALHGLDLEIARGEAIVLLGPSGCGKTTTLRLLAGFERPDGGRIEVADRLVASADAFVPPDQRQMSVVFQTYALWPHMTVRDNVAFGPQLRRRRARDWVRGRVEHSLSLVKLDGLADRYPHELSGGQQQRVALARALAVEPEILLLDEPLSNLDTRLREEMRFEVKRLQRDLGVTMVYVTHDPAEALSLADRIVVMNRGRIEQVGSPSELYLRPRTRFVATSLGPTNLLPAEVSDDGRLAVLGAPLPMAGDVNLTGPRSVTVSVRPSCIEIGHPLADDRVLGRVEEALFFGDVVQYAVRVAGVDTTVKATVPGLALHRPGDEVALRFSTTGTTVLQDTATEPQPAAA